LKHLSKHLTFANAISCIALFIALSGAAFAAKATLGNKAVKTRNLANGSVTKLKLHRGAVATLKLRNGAVTGAKIAPGAVGSTQLADGGVRSVDLGGGVVTEGKLKNGAVTENKLGVNAVSTGKIENGAVTSGKLATSFVGQLVKNVSYVTKTSLSNTTEKSKSVIAECPTGKQVTGGGARIVGAATKVAITESGTSIVGQKRTGWSAAARDITETEGTSWAVEATAICAEF
jgi:hypothetical protein